VRRKKCVFPASAEKGAIGPRNNPILATLLCIEEVKRGHKKNGGRNILK